MSRPGGFVPRAGERILWAMLLLAPWGWSVGGARGAAVWRFSDATGPAGVTSVHADVEAPFTSLSQRAAGGVAAGDYDGDGLLDLYVVGGDAGGNLLFRNQGDGTFSETA